MNFRRRLIWFAAASTSGLAIVAAALWFETAGVVRRTYLAGDPAIAYRSVQVVPRSVGFEPVASTASYQRLAWFDKDLWAAGAAGLARYRPDGTLAARWRPGRELPAAPITALVVGRAPGSRQTVLLATTAGEGLLLIRSGEQPDSVGITQIRPDPQRYRDLTAAAPLKSGPLLLGTQQAGVLIWKGGTLEPLHSELDDLKVTALAGDEGDLWIGTAQQGLLHWSGGSLRRFDEAAGLPDPRVLSLAKQGDRVWAGTALGSVAFLAGAFETAVAEGFLAASLVPFSRSGDAALAIGTLDEGVLEVPQQAVRRPSQQRLQAVVGGPSGATALAAHGEDLWAAAPDGIWSNQGASRTWRRVVTPRSTGLRDTNVSALHHDSNGRLWVGYFDRGLDVLDGELQRISSFESDQVFCVNRIGAGAQEGVTAAATANGLALFDAVPSLKQFLTQRDGLLANHVTDFALTASGLVLATPAGVSFLEPSGPRGLNAFHGLVNNHVYTLESSGPLLLAGTLGGVSMIDGGEVTASFTTANSDLSHNWITAAIDVDGEWWVGTYGGGVARRREGSQWRFYPELEGVEINPNCLLATRRGIYAGGLDRGLLVYRPRVDRWDSIVDGLPSMNVTALEITGDMLYIGTDSGLVRIDETTLWGN